MSDKTYWEKLKDPRWQKKRLEVMQSRCFACEICGDSHSILNVHHKQYFKSREPWEYDISQLAVLCEQCHESIHSVPDPLLFAASFSEMDGPQDRVNAAYVLAGFIGIPIEKLDYLGINKEWGKNYYDAGVSAFSITEKIFSTRK